MRRLFSIRHNERIPALVAFIFIVILNVLNVAKYYDKFSVVAEKYHDLFWNTYHVSGYDLHTYSTVSSWDVLYEVTRHPLMAFAMFVPAELNQALISLTGTNWATTIVGIIWAIFSLYAFIFLFRILNELMEVGVKETCLLCALFYSFGFIMVSTFVPDHFGPSMTLLLMTIYILGGKMKRGEKIGIAQTIILFVLTAGVTLSNGVKVFIASLVNRKKSFFDKKYLIFAVILPATLLFGFAQLEQQIFIQPKLDAQQQLRNEANKKHRAELYKAYCDTAKNLDSASVSAGVKKIIHDEAWAKYREDHKKPWNQHAGKPMGKTGFAAWTDISTPRLESIVENIFGDPIQIHRQNFLEDVNLGRPVILNYEHWYNYLAEALLVLLMLIGIWVGRKSNIVWMALSFFAFDMLLHLGLGFGLNEVYIMSPHFLFIIPVCIAPLIKESKKTAHIILMSTVSLLTMWFAYWNLHLLIPFLMASVS